MLVAIVLLLGLAAWLAVKDRPRRIARGDNSGLGHYSHVSRREGAFPFDYSSR